MLNIFALCLVMTSIIPVSVYPLDSKNVSFMVISSDGNSCVTSEGESGECIAEANCKQHFPNSSSPSVCDVIGFRSSFVCCPYYRKHSLDHIHRLKREAPPPPADTPKLRVKGCGVRGSVTDFIVGGEKADFWPWMAGIFVKKKGAKVNTFTCGGAVISKRYVLTAAHCVGQKGKTISPQSASVRVGSLNRSGGKEFAVASIAVHENYKDNLHYDDIAVLKTSRPMEVKNVVPVCLPSPGMYNSNFFQRKATVLGWGDVAYGGASTESLREVVVPIIPNKRCDARYKRLSALSLTRGIIDTQLCAGAQDGSRDACQGDSGGPLLLEDKSGKWNVIGIVSFGYRCGEPDYPGVYTRVAKYLKWLARRTDIPPRPYP